MPVHDLSGNVGAFQTHTVTRRRYTDGTVVNGVPSAATYADTSFAAVVQPVPGRVAERLALGERARDAVTVRVTGGDLTERDDLVIDGVPFTVVEAKDWRVGGNYVEAVAVKRGAA